MAAVLVAITLGAATGVFARNENDGAAFEAIDADANGSISEAEFDAMRDQRFSEADKDGSGSISEAEMVQHAEARVAESGRNVPADKLQKRVSKMFSKMDKNGDGVIDQSEHSGRTFAQLDTDGDGELSKDELKKARDQRQG
ncbi:MAG: EF-hand domain-containing protein [Pseudomonadota bacterium]